MQVVRTLAPALIGAVLLGATSPVASASSSAEVAELYRVSPHRDLFSLATDRQDWVAVGALGTVLESRDGGRHWTEEPLETMLSLLAVDIDGGQAVGVGQMGLVAARTDKGWRIRPAAPTRERLLAVATERGGLTAAVGAFGTVLVSADAGQSWQPAEIDWMELDPAGREPHLYDVHVEGNRILIVGEFGMVLESLNGGGSWQLLRRGDESLFALHVQGRNAYAVGQNGIVIRSVDSGSSWEQLETGVVANLLGIASRDGSAEMIVSGMRAVLNSTDGGATWDAIAGDDFSRHWYGDAAWSHALEGFVIVGGGGKIKQVNEQN